MISKDSVKTSISVLVINIKPSTHICILPLLFFQTHKIFWSINLPISFTHTLKSFPKLYSIQLQGLIMINNRFWVVLTNYAFCLFLNLDWCFPRCMNKLCGIFFQCWNVLSYKEPVRVSFSREVYRMELFKVF